MGLFEWLGEYFNPGPVGTIDTGPQPLFKANIKRVWVVLTIIIGLGLLAFFIFFAFNNENKILSLSILFIYLIASYLLTPKPDTSNVGWFGGLMNNPLRVSDNFNR